MESGLFSSLVPHGLLVKLVFTKARPNTLQVGDVVTQLLDSFHLLMQIVTLNEVGHLEQKNKQEKQLSSHESREKLHSS